MPETCWASNKICNKNSSVASSWHFISTPLILVVRFIYRVKIIILKININIIKDSCRAVWPGSIVTLIRMWRIALHWFESAAVWNLTVFDHFLLQSPISNCLWWIQRKQFGWFFRNDFVKAFLQRYRLHFHCSNPNTTNNVRPVDTNVIFSKWKWKLYWQQWKGWLLWSTLAYLHFYVVIVMWQVSYDWCTGRNKTGTRFLWYYMIYLLNAIGLSPGGRSTVHIYTQIIHRTKRNKQYIEQHKNFGRVRAVPRLG